MTDPGRATGASDGIEVADLHRSLMSPVGESMNFLNEIAQRYPSAVSFAAGRPYEGFLDVDLVHSYLNTFRNYLMTQTDGDEARVNRTMLQYGRTKGIVHELVAEHLKVDEGVTVDPEAIVVTVGCQEALYLTLRVLRRDDRDSLLAVVPSYVGVHGAAELAEMRVVPVVDDGTGIDLGDLRRTVEQTRASGLRPRALYLNPDFANPSGTSLDLKVRESLLQISEDLGFLVLEDNPYGMFGDGPAAGTMKSLDKQGRVVYLGTFAKTGIPGARVGYVVADQQVTLPDGRHQLLADQIGKAKSMVTVNTSPIAQAVIGGKLLENGYSLRRANERERTVYRDNLRLLVDGLAKHFPEDRWPGITWKVPMGGFFLFMEVPFVACDQMLEVSARKYGVLWTPGHYFYADAQPRARIRLSFSHLQPHEIEMGLERLAAFVEDASMNPERYGARP